MIDSHIITLIASFLSGIFSTISVLSYKKKHKFFSLNDFYFIILMTSYFYLFMGLIMFDKIYFFIGGFFVILALYLLRKQSFITKEQYLKSIIPYNSSCIFLTKKHLENNSTSITEEERIQLNRIIRNKEKEIDFLMEEL